jgi:hypothetical protein
VRNKKQLSQQGISVGSSYLQTCDSVTEAADEYEKGMEDAGARATAEITSDQCDKHEAIFNIVTTRRNFQVDD